MNIDTAPLVFVKDISSKEFALNNGFHLVERKQCPACKSQERTWVLRTYDDRYGFPSEFDLVKCNICETKYLLYCIAPDETSRLYQQYYKNIDSQNILKRGSLFQAFRFFIRHSKIWDFITAGQDLSQYTLKDEDILDVGCGFGNNAASCLYRGGKWFGLDVDSKVIAFLKAKNLECVQGTLEEFALQTKRRFDKVFLSQVIEHTHDPILFLQSARQILKPGGTVILSCPNGQSRYQSQYGSNWLHWHVPYHISHFTPHGLHAVASNAGFDIDWLTVRTPPSWYLAQLKFKSTTLGMTNRHYDTRLKPFSWLIHTPYLFLLDVIFPKSGDAIVAQLSVKQGGDI